MPGNSAITAGGQNYQESPHNLLGYWMIEYDPETNTAEKIPVRFAENHFNVRKMLEDGICDDCVNVVEILPYPPSHTTFKIAISNPFHPDPPLGFDCRGIVMFNGSRTYPELNHTMPVKELGDGELLNAWGYTGLFNGSTVDHGILGYSKGNLATETIPDSTVNGYMVHNNGGDGALRNWVYSGSAEYYMISFPKNGPFVFGYAVDISWYPPDTPPGDDIDDYPITANAPEPWRLVIEQEPYGEALNPTGGQRFIQLEVYDWNETYYTPVIECPELFDGVREFENWDVDSHWWKYMVHNENNAPPGTYRALVKVPDPADETGPAWLDQNAYQVTDIVVHQSPEVYIHDITPEWLNITMNDIDVSGDYAYVSGGVHGLHVFDISDPENIQWISKTQNPIETGVSAFNILKAVDIVGSLAFGILLEGEILVYDISDPYAPQIVGSADIPKPCRANDIEVVGEIAYIAADYSVIAMDIYPLNEAHELSRVGDYSGRVDELAIKDNYMYGTAAFQGVSVIDISDPSSMEIVQTVPTDGHASGMEVKDDYLYVANGVDGLQVVDISDPPNAFQAATVGHTKCGYSNDVTIIGDVAFVVEDDWYPGYDPEGGLSLYDISDPTAPQYLKSVITDRFCNAIDKSDGYVFAVGTKSGLYSIDVDPVTTPTLVDSHLSYWFIDDIAYDNGKLYTSSNGAGIFITDVSVPEQAYTEHFEQILSDAWSIDAENNRAYVGSTSRLLIYDVTNPEATSLIAEHYFSEDINRILVEDNIAYFTNSAFGTYTSEFLIWDMEDPSSPVEYLKDEEIYNVDHFVIWKDTERLYLSQNKAHETEIFVYDINPPEESYLEENFWHGHNNLIWQGGFMVHGDNYFVGSSYENFDAVNLDTQDVVGQFNLNGDASDIALLGNYAFIACLHDGVKVIDISDPANMTLVDWASTPGLAFELELAGNYLYVADNAGGISIFIIN